MGLPTPSGNAVAGMAGTAALHPIDRFVRSRLSERGLSPNGPAHARELVRRVSYDLLGLPPSLEEVEAFAADPSEAAWLKLIDQLLARPQYGERWARHWLDVVRFAQSNGYERDSEKLFAWRYRDYVIQALNDDLPYNQFVREQLAGDLLAEQEGEGEGGGRWRQQLIATGFLHLGVVDDEPDDKLQAEFDGLDDVVGTTGAAFLGLTLNCARCHDHKFDPLPQKDYYSILSFFRGLRPPGKGGLVPESAFYAPLATRRERQEWERRQKDEQERIRGELAATPDEPARRRLRDRLKQSEEALPPFEHVLAAREREDGSEPPVQVLLRGNPRSPGDRVTPRFPSAIRVAELCNGSPASAEVAPRMRRLALADWIAHPGNPLTARVLVNRVWHHHFGKGLVGSTMDFGRAGLRPTHPALLDWLAQDFIRSGWSMKHLHRLILSSQTWRASAQERNPAAEAADPANDLWWRQGVRRLDAEALRDTMLAVSGRLNLAPGGRGFFPRLSGEVLAGGSRPGTDWELSPEDQLARRSIYGFIRRTSMVPMFEVFDYSNATSPLGERPRTTVAPQALLLLNDQFMQDQANALAARVGREMGDSAGTASAAWVDRIWALALARRPSERERSTAVEFLRRQELRFAERQQRLLFSPDVPDTLSVGYFNKLPASLFLLGPTAGWSYYKGSWPREYEGNRNMEPGRGPFALCHRAEFQDGEVQCSITPKSACESFSLLLRATGDTGLESGYELRFRLSAQWVELRRLDGTNVSVLGTARCSVPVDAETRVRWEWDGDRYIVELSGGGQPRWEGRDPAPLLKAGRFGLRCWGAGVELDQVTLRPRNGPAQVVAEPMDCTDPRMRARQSLALLVLNLNEMVYLD